MAIHNPGKEATAGLLSGVETNYFQYLAVGSGTAGSITLGNEYTGSGLERGLSTNILTTTTVTNDTAMFIKQWTTTGDVDITEWGLFNESSVGSPIATEDMSTVSLNSGDTFQLTVKVQVS